jgi:uncharacterized protein YjiS (DUF1127 family)
MQRKTMTYTTHTDPALSGTSVWRRLSDLRANLAERRAQDRSYRTTVRELSALSDRDLLDMGIHPADIDSIARQAAYGA